MKTIQWNKPKTLSVFSWMCVLLGLEMRLGKKEEEPGVDRLYQRDSWEM